MYRCIVVSVQHVPPRRQVAPRAQLAVQGMLSRAGCKGAGLGGALRLLWVETSREVPRCFNLQLGFAIPVTVPCISHGCLLRTSSDRTPASL